MLFDHVYVVIELVVYHVIVYQVLKKLSWEKYIEFKNFEQTGIQRIARNQLNINTKSLCKQLFIIENLNYQNLFF